MAASTRDATAMKMHTFDIRIALVGYVSVGKSTVLNALLGDKFSQVALKRTTAGVNFFRIVQPAGDEKDKPVAAPNQSQEWSIIDDDKDIRKANDVHEEISKDNKELRSSETVKEKTFDIQVGYPICKMRKDTQLVLIDIPGINEAESSKKYKDYVKSNWKSFDCVVVVMDATEGVYTEEQVDLLKFVKSNNEELKDIPTIVLGNKMDDLDDEDTIHLIEETRSKTIEIFGNVDCESVPNNIVSNDEVDASGNTDEGVINTAFVPLSAKNAFTYMKAGCIDLDQLNDPKHLDIVNKIGNDEYGRKWKKMKEKEKIDIVTEILQDKSELDDRLAGTNFNAFLSMLSVFVGGEERQREILVKQLDIALEALRSGSLGDKPLSEPLYEAFKRYKTIGRTDVDGLQETFWKIYGDCENNAFENGLEERVDPASMERPFLELEKYHKLTSLLQWTEESTRSTEAMKDLLRRQLHFLLDKLEAWSFESYCIAAGGESYPQSNGHSCEKCPYIQYSSTYCGRVVNNSGSYFVCQRDPTAKIIWKDGWKPPEDVMWATLSPNDWIVILDSLSLVWNRVRFLEDFGNEKLELNSALMRFHSIFRPISGIFSDSISMSPSTRICLHVYREEIEKKNKYLQSQIKMPTSLSQGSHWGFLASRYIDFCNDYDQ